MRHGPGEAVELPNNSGIESPAMRISQNLVEFGVRLLGPCNSAVNVAAHKFPTTPATEFFQFAALQRGVPTVVAGTNLPALGLYGRHAERRILGNEKVESMKLDERPAAVIDDVRRLEMSGFEPRNVSLRGRILISRNVSGALLCGNRPTSPMDVFLSILGATSGALALRANSLELAGRPIQQSPEVPHGAVSKTL